jgi:septin family protein
LDRVKKVDIEYLRSLHHLCNVVPVLVKTDLLSRDQEYQLKCKVLQELKDNGIDIYQCGHSLEKLSELCRQGSQVAPPFSISTKFTSNVTNDGGTTVLDSKSGQYHLSSLHQHFSSATGYSKLMHLKDTLFYTHVDQLRQSTVAKFMAWRRSQTSIRRYYRQHQDLHHLAIPSGSTYSSQSTIPFSTTLLSPSSPSPSLLSTASSKEKLKTKNRNETICNTTMMFDLESIATDLAAREIAERIQDMALKQRSTVRIHMVNYVNEQKELLERRKNDKLIQLMHTYHTLEQKEKIKFLTGELNGVLSDLGLVASPSPCGTQVTPAASYMGGFLRIFKHGDKSIAVFDPPWLPLLLAVLPVLYFYITSYSG